MRVKFTIAICALLVLGLAVSQVNAQGYKVSSKPNSVVQYGNNQALGDIRLTFRTAEQGGFNIVQNTTIEITYGGLTLSNVTLNTTDGGGIATSTAAIGNIDDDNKNQKIVITVNGTPGAGNELTVEGVRADVSGLDAGTVIMATISATGTGDGFSDFGDTSGTSVTGIVSTVKDGINVSAVGQISVLTCDTKTTGGRRPSITVEEGFTSAWETDAGDGLTAAAGDDRAGTDDTHIRVIVANVPSGITFTWPGEGNVTTDGSATTNPTDFDTTAASYFPNPAAQMYNRDGDAATDDTAIANIEFVSSGGAIGEDKTKHWAVYRFIGEADDDPATGNLKDHDEVKNSFKIEPKVNVDPKKTGMGGLGDVWAQLWPEKGKEDIATVLSYATPVETKDEGYFVNVTECVTYLLFPFLTCGAQADWTTGIAVANTSMDDEVFPVNAGAAAQGGSVMIHAYPKSTMAEKMAAGHNSSPEELADPISTGISGNLAAGDSVAITCNTHPMLAGFEGYAIVRAAFRHAHGMAFVLGNFMDGAAIDVAHGYIALVIPDPEFAGDDGAPIGRGAASGESLGH
ncbi:MAG: hypothetical protein F4X27_04280 [Chloroflexi bacterium]|nr:hypothetical protein [Chloroflexota bacterium]